MSDALRAEVSAYLRRTGASPANFGRAAAGDNGFVGRLMVGREVRAWTAAKVRRFMAEHPDGTPEIGHRRTRERAAVNAVATIDPSATLPRAVGPAPFPTMTRVAEDHGALASRIIAQASREGRPVAELLSELVAVGFAARYGEAA